MTWLVALKALFGALLGPLAALAREMRARAAGKQEGRQEGKIDTLEAHIDTLRRMDSAPVTDDADLARSRLRQRKPGTKQH